VACASNTSKGASHAPQAQSGPIGGAVRHVGQAKPAWRGMPSTRERARACWNPRQQFMPTKAARMPNHADSQRSARYASPATPTKPIAAAAIRLRARPSANHSSERRIWPPSSG
jgi:hypothetical protein